MWSGVGARSLSDKDNSLPEELTQVSGPSRACATIDIEVET